MGPTWVLSTPDWPHVGPMNLAIGDDAEVRIILDLDNKGSVAGFNHRVLKADDKATTFSQVVLMLGLQQLIIFNPDSKVHGTNMGPMLVP